MLRIAIVSVVLGIAVSGCFKERRSKRAGHRMQDFIVAISDYARSFDSDFIIIPQNGEEVLFTNIDSEEALNDRVLNAISAIGTEEIFYNGAFAPDNYRLDMLLQIRNRVPVLVADFLDDNSQFNQAVQYNSDVGFVAFPRTSENYDYIHIPDTVHHENANDIQSMSDVRNYLYLISDAGYISKQEYLTAIQQTNFDLIIMDAFYGDQIYTAAEIDALKTKANGGKRLVVAYMSIGSAENYRYYWQSDWKLHKPRWLKKAYDGYEDEFWVKFWKKEWQDIIYGNNESYTKKLLDAHFDGAYLDNIEVFYSLYFND